MSACSAPTTPVAHRCRELIQLAKDMGLGVAIASSGAPEKIHLNLSSSNLLELLDERYIVSATHVDRVGGSCFGTCDHSQFMGCTC